MSLKSERAKFRIPLLDPVDQFCFTKYQRGREFTNDVQTVHSSTVLPRHHLSFLHHLLTISTNMPRGSASSRWWRPLKMAGGVVRSCRNGLLQFGKKPSARKKKVLVFGVRALT